MKDKSLKFRVLWTKVHKTSCRKEDTRFYRNVVIFMKKILAMILSVLTLSGCGLFTTSIPEEQLVIPEQDSETTAETSASETESEITEQTIATEDTTAATTTEAVTSETTAETENVSANTVAYTSDELDAAMLIETLKVSDNFVISPLSAKLAMNMAAVGADGNTAQEMLTAFGYSSADDAKEESQRLMTELSPEDGSITVNNAVWISDRMSVLYDDYTADLNDFFSAESFVEDLTSGEIVGRVNGWINDKTNGLIPEMISEPFGEDSRMILVNTIYFNKKWCYPFDSFSTREQDFYGTNGTETVEMMHNYELSLDYAEGDVFRSVIMEYCDGGRMKIYLPKDEDANIADIISNSTFEELNAETNLSYESEKVDISLPKFEYEYKGSLIDTLKTLGISDAFSPDSADFGKISDEPLFISTVVQAAKIRCDEEGTEAAAATMIGCETTCVAEPVVTIDFTVDRPFMYEIESESGETLFMGVIQNFS